MQVRLNAVFAALLYSSVLWGRAFADEIDDLEETSTTTTEAATASASTISRPQFTVRICCLTNIFPWQLLTCDYFKPTSIKAPFYEQFTDDWKSRWVVSKAKKVNDKTDNEEWAYVGQWAVEEPTALKGIDGDKGLGKWSTI